MARRTRTPGSTPVTQRGDADLQGEPTRRARVSMAVDWSLSDGGVELVSLARLLAALDATPRMAAAASGLAVSYRTAWGRLVSAEEALGIQLVERVKGHGSELTDAGRALIGAVTAFERNAQRSLRGPLAALEAAVLAMTPDAAASALRLSASHDLLLQGYLADRRASGVRIRVVGSEDALRALERGEADLAGFHAPAGERAAVPVAPGGEACVCRALLQREQGLIVARGNPMRIRDVTDLARTGLRFVNRQRGAATRTWLDRLLREGGVDAARIAGYEVEEGTHLAVAATVAAGGADAGFGLRAAADRFGLGFVPIGIESYWLGGLARLKRDPRVLALIDTVSRMAGETPGYSAVGSHPDRANTAI
jgi:molybdate transport repressor ModE-like protein